MITLPRAAIERFRAVMRRSCPRAMMPPAITIRSGSRSRGLEAVAPDMAIRLMVPGRGPSETLAMQTDALDSIAGNDGDVTLSTDKGGQIAAAWEDGGAAQHRQFPVAAPATVRPFPNVPRDLTPLDPSLLTALATAAPLAPKQASRYAMQNLLLDGRTGRVVVTDSRQLLVQSRWPFPWEEQVLIPALTLWTCRELRDEPVAVGRTEKQLVLTSGPWTAVVPIDREGRYPAYADIMPKANRIQNRVQFTDADCDLIRQQLPRLPSVDEETQPIDLIIGSAVAIQAGDKRLELPSATATGPAIRFNCDRRMLMRALRLGFRELHIVTPLVPAVFVAENRQFVFMPLTPSDRGSAKPAVPSTSSSLEKPPMAARNATPEPSNNGHADAATNGTANGQAPDPLTEAEAVRSLLRDADARMGRLVAYLKHHRRQSRVLRSAMDSLRGMPELVQ
jgi:hypothetical protein